MSIYIPYTYLIGWSSLNKWYYGVRFAKSCSPSDLWVTYFTSSKIVKQYRKEYGEPDVIQVRQTFTCADAARRWETRVLQRLNVIESTVWLNKTDNIAIASQRGPDHPFYGRKHTEEARKKMSERKQGSVPHNKGKKASEVDAARLRRLAAARKGKSRPEHVTKMLTELNKGNNWNLGRKFDVAVYSSRSKTYDITFPNGDTQRVINLKEFCRTHGLKYTSRYSYIDRKPWEGYIIKSVI